MYAALDIFLTLLHGLLVMFNLTGWAWKRTRRLHLVCISLTFLSWFGLGMVYGWGYCPPTEWHWQVKERLGETNLPSSWVKYYADALTGRSWAPGIVDTAVFVGALLALAASCWLNWKDWRSDRKNV